MAAIGFALVDILNRSKKFSIQLSPVFLAIVAILFFHDSGRAVGIFRMCMDRFFGMDMQKDTIIHGFSSVMLDPTHSNIPVPVENITEVIVNGKELGLGGYLDIGLLDTMNDLFVNFIGRWCFP